MEPFQITFGFKLPDLTLSTGDEFTVPKGKRLVIELIAGQGSVEAEQILEAGIATTVNGNLANYPLVLSKEGIIANRARFVGSQLMRVYADPGTVVFVSAGRTAPGSGSAEFTLAISGQLVDVP
jgi:hypothetical protein